MYSTLEIVKADASRRENAFQFQNPAWGAAQLQIPGVQWAQKLLLQIQQQQVVAAAAIGAKSLIEGSKQISFFG